MMIDVDDVDDGITHYAHSTLPFANGADDQLDSRVRPSRRALLT